MNDTGFKIMGMEIFFHQCCLKSGEPGMDGHRDERKAYRGPPTQAVQHMQKSPTVLPTGESDEYPIFVSHQAEIADGPAGESPYMMLLIAAFMHALKPLTGRRREALTHSHR
jgi:hypothetical protein